MEIKYRQMSGKNECEYGIFHDTSLKRHMRFFPKRKRHNRSTTGDMPTGTETDDDSLMGILGGPYQPPNKEDPAIIHLKYSIPRNNDGVNPVTGNQKQVLNPFNRSGLMREKERGSCVCTSRCRVSECNFKQIFRRKKDHPSRGRQLESNITSTQPTNEGPKSAGIFWKLGRKIEWPTRRTIRNTFRIPRIRQTTRPTDDSYDVWSDVSSLGASSYSASETIVVSS